MGLGAQGFAKSSLTSFYVILNRNKIELYERALQGIFEGANSITLRLQRFSSKAQLICSCNEFLAGSGNYERAQALGEGGATCGREIKSQSLKTCGYVARRGRWPYPFPCCGRYYSNHIHDIN